MPAQLLLLGADETVWQRAIAVDNVLQKTSPASAKRMSYLIRKRLEMLPLDMWSIVANGTTEVATQTLLSSAIKTANIGFVERFHLIYQGGAGFGRNIF